MPEILKKNPLRLFTVPVRKPRVSRRNKPN